MLYRTAAAFVAVSFAAPTRLSFAHAHVQRIFPKIKCNIAPPRLNCVVNANYLLFHRREAMENAGKREKQKWKTHTYFLEDTHMGRAIAGDFRPNSAEKIIKTENR